MIIEIAILYSLAVLMKTYLPSRSQFASMVVPLVGLIGK